LSKPQLRAASRFVDTIRGLYQSEPDLGIRWTAIREAMIPLLTDPGLKESSKRWPLTVADAAGGVRNLLFYEDPDYGFVFNATVRKANSVTSIHDHGDIWTLYGLIDGHETMHRFERTDSGHPDKGPAALKETGSQKLGPGDVDAVAPRGIHQEHGGPANSMAFIVRAQKAGTFKQRNFNPETGEIRLNNGPTLIEFALD
jgi:predicted metal-dependent enzyme (double-stranded beta helix superfamily)